MAKNQLWKIFIKENPLIPQMEIRFYPFGIPKLDILNNG